MFYKLIIYTIKTWIIIAGKKIKTKQPQTKERIKVMLHGTILNDDF